MIEIDGLEGGGQIVRTAVAMSALTGKAVRVINIRGARPQPGLKTQHLEGIRAVAALCGAEVRGLKLGSRQLEFVPSSLVEKGLEINISTAGAIGLVLQALLIPISKLKHEIKIRIIGGGTWNKWAPPVLYFKKVLFPLLREQSEIKILRDGFYPKGGAQVEVIAKPWTPRKLEFVQAGQVERICGVSVADSRLSRRKVAERQAQAATEILNKAGFNPNIEIKYVSALNPGCGILLWAKTSNSVIGSDAVGELKKSAEDIGRTAAQNLLAELDGAVDSHAADMLLPYMALARAGKIKTSKITDHIRTNISVIERFLPVKFEIKEKIISLLPLSS